MTDMTGTVFLVDDEQVIRDSISVLMGTDGIPCEVFASPQMFLDQFDPSRPGCLLLDLRMPGMDGLELLERLQQRGLDIPVIILTAHADVPRAVAAMKSGAKDFMEKPFSAEDLLRRVREAIRCDAEARHDRIGMDEITQRLDSLTPRETEILKLIVLGEPTKRIAAALGTSANTVRNQRSSILRKMEANSVVDLVRMATAARLT